MKHLLTFLFVAGLSIPSLASPVVLQPTTDTVLLDRLLTIIETDQAHKQEVIKILLKQNEANAERVNENCRKKSLLEKLGLK